MSALLDELRSVLTHFRGHLAEQVNSGALVTIDRHLATLDAVAHDASKADEAVRGVLGELYGSPAPTAPVEAPAPVVEEHQAAVETVAATIVTAEAAQADLAQAHDEATVELAHLAEPETAPAEEHQDPEAAV